MGLYKTVKNADGTVSLYYDRTVIDELNPEPGVKIVDRVETRLPAEIDQEITVRETQIASLTLAKETLLEQKAAAEAP